VYCGRRHGARPQQGGNFARTAIRSAYVAAGDILDLVQAVAALQRDHADRELRATPG